MSFDDEDSQETKKEVKVSTLKHRLLIRVTSLIMFLLLGYFISSEKIDQGNVAVVTRWGKISYVAEPGLNFRIPFMEEFHIFSTREQVYETSEDPAKSKADFRDIVVTAQTSDGQPITITYSSSFRINKEQVYGLYINTGESMERIVERVVKMYSRSIVRLAMQDYEAATLYSNKLTNVQKKIEEELGAMYQKHYIDQVQFLIRKIDFDPKYVAAVTEKEIAKQAITTAKHKADAAEHTANQKKFEGQGEKEYSIEKAKGEAEAIREKGKALKDNPEMLQFELVSNLKNVQVVYLPSDKIVQMLPAK